MPTLVAVTWINHFLAFLGICTNGADYYPCCTNGNRNDHLSFNCKQAREVYAVLFVSKKEEVGRMVY